MANLGRKRNKRNGTPSWHRTHFVRYVGKKPIALLDEAGNRIRNNTPEGYSEAERAIYRWKLGEPAPASKTGHSYTVDEICNRYLTACKKNNRESTFTKRKRILFDFCTGYFPALMEQYSAGNVTAQEKIHPGYGDKLASVVIQSDGALSESAEFPDEFDVLPSL